MAIEEREKEEANRHHGPPNQDNESSTTQETTEPGKNKLTNRKQQLTKTQRANDGKLIKTDILNHLLYPPHNIYNV